MLIYLFLAFTIVPAIELFLLLQMGSLIGPLPTFAFVLGTGVAGAWLGRREGTTVWRKLTAELANGLPPGPSLMEAALVLAGALLLVTPGVLTDLTGILFLFPPTRRWLAPVVGRWLAARFGGGVALGPGRASAEGTTADGVRYRAPIPTPVAEAKRKPFSTPFDD